GMEDRTWDEDPNYPETIDSDEGQNDEMTNVGAEGGAQVAGEVDVGDKPKGGAARSNAQSASNGDRVTPQDQIERVPAAHGTITPLVSGEEQRALGANPGWP